MSRLRCLLFAIAICALICLTAPQGMADQVVIGASDSANRFPFGVDSVATINYQAGSTYQQFYSRNRFTAPVKITQLSFASSSKIGMPGTAHYDFNLRLGTAATPIAAPSSRFSQNRGGDLTTVFSSQLTAILTRSDTFDLVIDLATPFSYDPRRGDLLLDVTINKPTTYSGSDLYFVAGVSDDLASIFNNKASEDGIIDEEFRYGPLTRFTTETAATIPEPATMLLFGTGLAGLGGIIRRRR